MQQSLPPTSLRWSPSFNPHPTSRSDATGQGHRHPLSGEPRFNPHPTSRSDATHSQEGTRLLVKRFNPHPTSRSDATSTSMAGIPAREFQSSSDLEVGCNNMMAQKFAALGVSILIRPRGRMQHLVGVGRAGGESVSILIRPRGRMQPSTQARTRLREMFQSSSDLEVGCNSYQGGVGRHGDCFNPHPTSRSDATSTRPRVLGGAKGFNPHPTSRSDATTITPVAFSITFRFQSSSDLEVGCNISRVTIRMERTAFQSSSDLEVGCNSLRVRYGRGGEVSILIRPRGRMQLFASGASKSLAV